MTKSIGVAGWVVVAADLGYLESVGAEVLGSGRGVGAPGASRISRSLDGISALNILVSFTRRQVVQLLVSPRLYSLCSSSPTVDDGPVHRFRFGSIYHVVFDLAPEFLAVLLQIVADERCEPQDCCIFSVVGNGVQTVRAASTMPTMIAGINSQE